MDGDKGEWGQEEYCKADKLYNILNKHTFSLVLSCYNDFPSFSYDLKFSNLQYQLLFFCTVHIRLVFTQDNFPMDRNGWKSFLRNDDISFHTTKKFFGSVSFCLEIIQSGKQQMSENLSASAVPSFYLISYLITLILFFSTLSTILMKMQLNIKPCCMLK